MLNNITNFYRAKNKKMLKNITWIQTIIKDTAEPWQIGFQDSASPIMEEITHLHDHIMFFICIITVFVITLMRQIIKRFTNRAFSNKYMIHGTALEIIWTIIPALILISIAFPSFQLLYLMDEVINPAITIKAIGHQWYWSYEYSDYEDKSMNFDSYMIPTEDLEQGGLRLLEVDNRIVLPIDTHVRIIVTGADVLHSWAMPALGVKVDAIPGRLNQTSFLIKRPGVFYGQCSEICGFGHGFMPIVIEGVKLNEYITWVSSKLQE
jgi:cytochrome c oxidase subunit 2